MRQVTILALVLLVTVAVTSAKSAAHVFGHPKKSDLKPMCMPDGEWFCATPFDCCSGICMVEVQFGAFVTVCQKAPCRPKLVVCTEDSQCCSGYCNKDSVIQHCAEKPEEK